MDIRGHRDYTSNNDCCGRGDGIEERWTRYGGGGLGGGEGGRAVCGERRQQSGADIEINTGYRALFLFKG